MNKEDNSNVPVSQTETQTEFKLIDGVFDAADARELLLAMISHKIDFHRMNGLSSKELYGKNDINSEERVAMLISCRNHLSQFFKLPEQEGRRVRIHANVRIEIEK